ncbi:hypothetical protein ADIS_4033 [Lunatimonas lonarensis]|uniref:Uncharacterized protein n=1 Tax=Lunatimonas lonarensis TaxID=1232681 RepID=R7ZNE9_9BACT|nr:hypothetical protein [Lunatimonas lonarensis]EON75630.1 hypothetical protein ADIS_4033 [Lunatimonas lonarensis]
MDLSQVYASVTEEGARTAQLNQTFLSISRNEKTWKMNAFG